MYLEKKIKPTVFRAYDIRGVIDDEFDSNEFYTIGRAIAYRLYALNRFETFIARDGRLTSDRLAAALKQGLLDSGITVVDLGAVATPVMYYATHEQGIDCGLMVTGSHNPKNYNGIKMVIAGTTLAETEIKTLYDIVQRGNYKQGVGESIALNVIENYMQRVVQDIRLARPFKVVVDCGNGIAGSIIPQVLTSLGCEVIPLYCEVDGNFPNHHPDPTIEENLSDLKAAVLKHQAHLGFGFDGDADRLGLVTNAAKVIWPDRLMMYYAREILKHNPGGTIVFDVKCSAHLAKVIAAAGGKPLMCPTGHSIVKRVMKQVQAPLAGEMSGHLFFKDRWYGFDDALYSACRLLEIASHSHLSIDEQFAAIPDSVNTPELKITIAENEKFDFMQRFCEQAYFPQAHIVRIDGMRVEFAEGWGLVRASNTTPCLVARFEAQDAMSLIAIQDAFKVQLLKVDKTLRIPF